MHLVKLTNGEFNVFHELLIEGIQWLADRWRQLDKDNRAEGAYGMTSLGGAVIIHFARPNWYRTFNIFEALEPAPEAWAGELRQLEKDLLPNHSGGNCPRCYSADLIEVPLFTSIDLKCPQCELRMPKLV